MQTRLKVVLKNERLRTAVEHYFDPNSHQFRQEMMYFAEYSYPLPSRRESS